jgi:photosystem II stability/assembly factor-like uncharacterized protein
MSLPARRRARFVRAGLMLLVSTLGLAGLPLGAQQPADLFRHVSFREIGSTHRGGRFVDIAAVEATPRIWYIANATGGVWKTENNGVSFRQVFDSPTVASIGAVALSQSDPKIVYVGTGEANNSRSAYWGDGIYKSVNAGETWTNVGLKESHHIGRIIVHPTDPNTVYAAALGKLYSENEERGVYKTVDGGKTWAKSLAIQIEGKHIGVVDLAMDPKNPAVLYAAAYDKVRRPWTFAEGGPGSGIYKTADAGKSWTKLGGGLPVGLLGRIGLSVARNAPTTIYAVIENVGVLDEARRKRYAEGFGAEGGSPSQLYRSDDAGKTWRQVTPAPAPPAAAPAAGAGAGRGGRGGGPDLGNPGYYYAQVRVDPNDKETVYVLSVGWSRTRDGGATWQGMSAGGDNHALWINPRDSEHLILGYDHGFAITNDGGASWFRPENIPTAQYYAIGIDMAVPYNVYGGTQDNGCHKGPSSMPGGGNIPFEAWINVGCADGFYNEVEWRENRYLYNESQFGGISRLDQVTGQSVGLGAGRPQIDGGHRFNWNAPIVVSRHNPDVIYHASQVVLRSPFRGERWQIISPDLTVNDPAKRGGGGNITYATISTLAESPIVPGLLWAGTDDGNVQLTRNDGQSWTNLRDRIPGHPGFWVSRVEPSYAAAGTAYVTLTGYRNDDTRPFIFKTTDFGQTWTSIAGNLPQEAINVVRESPRNPNVLFAGTDAGVYATLDGGKMWSRLKGAPLQAGAGGGRGGGGGGGGGRGGGAAPAAHPRGVMPTVPVHDIKVHPRDRELVAGTHGRGIWIADVSEIEEMTPAVLASDAHLFEIDPVIAWVAGQRGVTAAINFAGISRPTDMGISYYLRSAASAPVTVRVYDGSRMIAELDGPREAGTNVVRWNLQGRRERIEGEAAAGAGGGRGGGGGGRAGGAGAAAANPAAQAPQAPTPVTFTAPTGTYRVVLTVGGREYTQSAVIAPDPRK